LQQYGGSPSPFVSAIPLQLHLPASPILER